MAKIIKLPNIEKLLGQLSNQDKAIIHLGLKHILDAMPHTIKTRKKEDWNKTRTMRDGSKHLTPNEYKLATINDMESDLKRTKELAKLMSGLSGFNKEQNRFKIPSDRDYGKEKD